MSLEKFAALFGKGAKGVKRFPTNELALRSSKLGRNLKIGGAAAGAAGLGAALNDDEMELDDIDDLDSAGKYGSQKLRSLISKLGLDL